MNLPQSMIATRHSGVYACKQMTFFRPLDNHLLSIFACSTQKIPLLRLVNASSTQARGISSLSNYPDTTCSKNLRRVNSAVVNPAQRLVIRRNHSTLLKTTVQHVTKGLNMWPIEAWVAQQHPIQISQSSRKDIDNHTTENRLCINHS